MALVTGASRGLGAHIARRLAADGMAVAVNGIDEAEVYQVAAGITTEGGAAEPFMADVTDPTAVEGLVGNIERALGPVDVLVFNATGPQPEADVADVAWSDHEHHLAFFVRSPVMLGRWVLPGMRERAYGRIVHVDSDMADRPTPGWSAYASAKAAQIGLARSWAVDLAPYGITVNSVAPGFIPVERHDGIDVGPYLEGVLVGRMGHPEDVANAVSFFASPLSGFITGQRITVDGGRALRA